MKHTKKTFLVCGLSLILSFRLLAGTTFAWFTSTVSSANNKITAGRLAMGGYAYAAIDQAVEGGATVSVDETDYHFEATSQNLRDDHTATIVEKDFNPQKTYAKLYEVKNEGTLDFKFKFDFMNCLDGGLGQQLWFDFIPITAEGKTERSVDKKELSMLETYLDEDQTEMTLSKDQSQQFIFLCGLTDEVNKDSFNETYAGCNFNFDIEIKAAQIAETFETISKDEPLIAEISDADGVDTMMRYIQNGNDVEAKITQPVTLNHLMMIRDGQTVKLNIAENTVLDIPNQVTGIAGFENAGNNQAYIEKAAITVQKGAVLELTGAGSLKSNDYFTLKVKEGGTLKIDGLTIEASNTYKDGLYGIYSQGDITLENTTLIVSTDNVILSSPENPSPLGGSTAYGIYGAGGTLKVNGGRIDVTGATNGNTGNGANGIYVNGAADVTITGTTITGTGEGTSQSGIYCFSGNIKLISGVNIDIKGTAVDTWGGIEKIEKSTLKGSAYSLYNRGNDSVKIDSETRLEGQKTGGVVQE